jgi:Tol biopolymer transport system component
MMYKRYYSAAAALLVLAVLSLACASTLDGAPTASPGDVATVVALTMQVLTPVSDVIPEPETSLLPHSLYYLGTDSSGLTQIYRLELDGKTQTQLTFEPASVLDFDVLQRDGSYAYEIDNRLVLVNGEGSNRRVLAEGNPRGNVRGFYRPVFSPDGGTLAYVSGGLNLYDVSTGAASLVVADRAENASLPRESYVPESFTPDGKKLLVHMLHTDTSLPAVYDVAKNALVPFSGKSDEDFACCQFGREIGWFADSMSFYSANPTPGVDAGGLWSVNVGTGEVTTIIPYGGGNNTFNFVDEPYAAPDGRFYYFFSNYDGNLGPLHRAPGYLEIIRVAGDSWNERTSLVRNESLRMMNEALWAPDGSFVIVALAPGEDVMDGGQAEIVYFDGRSNLVLAPFAQEMKWGP